MSTVSQILEISRNQFYFFRLNPLSLVDICTPVVNRFEDAEEALQFLEKIGDKVKANTEAFVMTRVLIGKLQLLQFKDVPKTKATVEEIDGLLNDVEGVGRVHAHYYLLATELYKSEGDHANYYRCVRYNVKHTVWKLRKFTLKLFWQKFREINGFTKEITK